MPRTAPSGQPKPPACTGCSLAQSGHGFVSPDGPLNAPILILGEAPGYEEVALGRPFVGAAGSMLERILRRNRLARSSFRVGNVISCAPQGLVLEGAPYQHSAIRHCSVHREALLNEGHPVVVAAGATAIKTLLHLHGAKRVRVEEFHGTVVREPDDRFWVVPTFHPSFLQRGAHNLIGTVCYDLQVAQEVAAGTWTAQPIETVIDPPVEWFRQWVEALEAAAAHDPDGVAVACDIETPDKATGKPENELTPEDDSYTITRFNVACHPDQGVTVPYEGDYIALVDRILQVACPHGWWNGYGYDWARVTAAGHRMDPRWQYDWMLAAHVLQSDVPLGLGFWAPFYSSYGPWKYLSESDPAFYACLDGPQTYRTGQGLIADLLAAGQWRAFEEDCHQLYHAVLKPAHDLGVLVDRPALVGFHEDLAVKQRRLLHEIQGCVPDALRPLTGETQAPPQEGLLHPAARTHALRTGEALTTPPDLLKQDLYSQVATRVAKQVSRLLQVCTACGAAGVSKSHRCKDAGGKPLKDAQATLVVESREVTRWFWQEPFNPDSSPQVLKYLLHRKHTPGKDKHTRKPSANRDTLIRLSRTTKDPLYRLLLNYRAVKKVDSTYATPTLARVDHELAEGREPRLHPIPTFRPSTMRLSYAAPNITNVVSDKGGAASLAAGFRRCLVAGPGCRLAEFDFSGIEAVEVGWYARDPLYLRLATLGVHAYLASHLLKRPADVAWSDADLLCYFQEIKASEPVIYDKAKRASHGTNFGLTPYGMAATFPDLYKDEKDAARVQAILFEVCPTLPVWHRALQRQAYEAGMLGGAGPVVTSETNACYQRGYAGPSPWNHPFQYRHWFWSVLAYAPISEAQRLRREKAKKACAEINGRWFAVDLGEDAKRVIAFFPQSTAAGVLKRSMRALFLPGSPSYIGDAYFGQTPLRAPIHDSLLLEIPDRQWDRVCEKVLLEMQRPIAEQPLPAAWGIGTHLRISVEGKVGRNWLDMEKLPTPLGARTDTREHYFGVEPQDEEDAADMGVVA
jgi:DNA polymerase